jgi:AcrR family transcriptional regulator
VLPIVDKSLDLHRKILDASVELVAEQGVRGVSFREVARRAGVSHQAPYHHFGNYQGILEAIAKEGFGQLAATMAAAAEAGPGHSMQALVASGVAYVRFAREHVGHFRVMFQQSLIDLQHLTPPMDEAVRTYQTLVDLVVSARQEGYGRELDEPVMVTLCWSIVHGLATLLVEGTLPPPPWEEVTEERLVELVLAGLGGLFVRSRRHESAR